VMKFMTGTFYDMLERGKISKRYYRDIYSLIHTVGDSYSDAHAERDTTTWEILYLKPWQATCWQPFLVNWSGWPYFFTDIMHKFPEDIRDKQYLRVDLVPQDEVTYYDKNPYLVPRFYLNTRGVQASDAVEDLFVIIFAILKETEQDQDKFVEVATREWRGYLERHFKCTVDTKTIPSLVVQPAPAEDQEWRPMIQVGIKGRNGSVPNAKDVVLAMDFAKPPSYIDPFGFAAGYDIGRRTIGNQTLWVGTVSFSLYLWQYTDYFATGIDPVIAELTYDNHRVTVEPMLAFIRFDGWISRRFWVSFEGLRYSLSNGFRSNEFSLTLGLAFSKEFPIQWTDWFTKQRYLEEIGNPAGNSWKTPDLDSPSRSNPAYYGYFHPVGYGFYKEPGHTSIFPTGYTFLRDIRGQSKFSRFAYGVNFGVGGEHYKDDTWALARVGPVGRIKLNELLAFQVEPVAGVYRWGLSKDAWSNLDAEATASFIVALGSFDVDIKFLRYSYDKRGLDQKAIAGIRIGVLRE
jgi:hypothetical protein